MAWEQIGPHHERNGNGYTLTRNVVDADGRVQWGAWPPESRSIRRREYAGPIGFFDGRSDAIAACRAHFEARK